MPDEEQPTHINPYREILEKELRPGYADIPPHFKAREINQVTGLSLTPDRLCDLPVMMGDARSLVFNELVGSISKGEHIAVICMDIDQLKSANLISHDFGDEAIIYSIARFARNIGDLDLGPKVRIIRSSIASDEVYAFVTNPTESDLARMTQMVRELNSRDQLVKVPNSGGKEVEYHLSSSVGITTSAENRLAPQIEQIRHELATNPSRQATGQAYDFIETMEEAAIDRSGGVKVLHELEQIPIDNLLGMDPVTYRKYVTSLQGGRRTSQAGLNILFMLDQIITARHISERISDGTEIPEDVSKLYEMEPGDLTLRAIIDAYNALFRKKD